MGLSYRQIITLLEQKCMYQDLNKQSLDLRVQSACFFFSLVCDTTCIKAATSKFFGYLYNANIDDGKDSLNVLKPLILSQVWLSQFRFLVHPGLNSG